MTWLDSMDPRRRTALLYGGALGLLGVLLLGYAFWSVARTTGLVGAAVVAVLFVASGLLYVVLDGSF